MNSNNISRNLNNLNKLLNPLRIEAICVKDIRLTWDASKMLSSAPVVLDDLICNVQTPLLIIFKMKDVDQVVKMKDVDQVVSGKTSDDGECFMYVDIDTAFDNIFNNITSFHVNDDVSIDNIYLGCKSLEEAFVRKDLHFGSI